MHKNMMGGGCQMPSRLSRHAVFCAIQLWCLNCVWVAQVVVLRMSHKTQCYIRELVDWYTLPRWWYPGGTQVVVHVHQWCILIYHQWYTRY